MEEAIKKDLICLKCGKRQALYLFFWKRYYREISWKRYAIIEPHILCDPCKKEFCQNSYLYQHQPVILHFKNLADLPIPKIGYLLSSKGKEFNALANHFWKRKIWRIRYVYRNRQTTTPLSELLSGDNRCTRDIS